MGVTDWLRRLFSPSTDGGRADGLAVLHEEDTSDSGLQRIRAQRGATGFAGLEAAEAVEDAIDAADGPSDPAP